MSEPAVQLQAVGEATERCVRGIAEQALEWVRVSEERVAEAEGGQRPRWRRLAPS